MPNKKTQRRPNRPRNRAPRPAPARETVEEEVLETVPAAAGAAVPAVPAAPSVARAVGTRRAQTPRRSAAAIVNYAYLRRDLTTLGILAPAMVILVVLAFIFIH